MFKIPEKMNMNLGVDLGLNITGKKFIIAVLSIVEISIICLALLIFFWLKMVDFGSILGLLSSGMTLIGLIAGGFLGIQAISDHYDSKNNNGNGKDKPVEKPVETVNQPIPKETKVGGV